MSVEEMEQLTYWKKEIETAPREKLEELQLARFKERMQYVYDRSPMYKRKYDGAGIKPSDIRTLDDIQHVPFTVKEDLRESQAKHPPWGDFFCIPPEESVRVFQTTGTSGIPVKIYLNKNDWTVHLYEQFMHQRKPVNAVARSCDSTEVSWVALMTCSNLLVLIFPLQP